MNIAGITKADFVNGLGVRLSLYVSGCLNHCKGCFQPETWNFNYGTPYSVDIEKEILAEISKSYYKGITILGGDPMEESNQIGILPLIKKIKEIPNKDIWIYTGYIYDKDLVPNGKRYFGDITDSILDSVDILVDGPFIIDKKDITLKFKGSSNQRIINMKETRKLNEIILLNL